MAAVGLIADQLDCETYSMPTGARIFERGTPAQAIYTVRKGIVELIGDQGEKIRYSSGELFSYQDIIGVMGFTTAPPWPAVLWRSCGWVG